MRIGLRGAFGQSTITLDDSATVADLVAKIKDASKLDVFDLKTSFPPETLDLTQFDETLKLSDTNLKLNGERIQVEERKIGQELKAPLANSTPSFSPPDPLSQSSNASTSSQAKKPLPLNKKPNNLQADPPALELSDGSVLLLRVMPDDNSCLFRALGKCLLGPDVDSMVELRSLVAQAIQADQDRFNEAVLQQKPEDYCSWIQTPDAWGGAIEVQILAEHFGVKVSTVNLEDCSIQRLGREGKSGEKMAYLVFSGIHYDALAANPGGKQGPPDFDITQFDADDKEVEEKALEIGRILSQAGYYTNTKSFTVKCNVCGEVGKGEKWATSHAESTGHQNFGEAS